MSSAAIDQAHWDRLLEQACDLQQLAERRLGQLLADARAAAAPLIVQREATGWTGPFGTLFVDEPKDWRRNQRDVWHCCPRRAWTARPYGGHELFAGQLRLSTHAPRDDRDGWCWYASIECQHGDGGSIASRGGYASEAEAQAAAIAFVKAFCKTALDALPAEAS